MDRCVVCRDSDWLLGRGSNRRIVGQSAAQLILPGVGGATANRRRGVSLLPSMGRQTLTGLAGIDVEALEAHQALREFGNAWWFGTVYGEAVLCPGDPPLQQ